MSWDSCSVSFSLCFLNKRLKESWPWLDDPETSLIIEGSLRPISRLVIQATHQLLDYETMYLSTSLHHKQGHAPISQMWEPCQLKATLPSREFHPPSLSAWVHRPADSCTVTPLDTKSKERQKAHLDATKDAERYPAIPYLNSSIGRTCGCCCNCVLIPIRLAFSVIVY